MKAFSFLPLLVAAGLYAPASLAMIPDEAYSAIPHRRTAYEPPVSTTTPEKARELGRLFALTDEGVILRVQGMRAHRERNTAEVSNLLQRYDALVGKLETEKHAPEISKARDLIVEGVRMHRKYLASRPAGGMTFVRGELVAAPDVTQASRKLIGACQLLMAAFPKEAARNKTAFYDHLCAPTTSERASRRDRARPRGRPGRRRVRRPLGPRLAAAAGALRVRERDRGPQARPRLALLGAVVPRAHRHQPGHRDPEGAAAPFDHRVARRRALQRAEARPPHRRQGAPLRLGREGAALQDRSLLRPRGDIPGRALQAAGGGRAHLHALHLALRAARLPGRAERHDDVHYKEYTQRGTAPEMPLFPDAGKRYVGGYLSGGAGYVGSGYSAAVEQVKLELIPLDAALHRTMLPASTPEVTIERYLRSLELGIGEPQLPLLTEASSYFRMDKPHAAGYLQRIRSYIAKGLPYRIQQQGDLAVVNFRPGTPVLPVFLRRDEKGLWRVDEPKVWASVSLYQDGSSQLKYLKSPYAFGVEARSGEQLWAVFGNQAFPPPLLPMPTRLTERLRRAEADVEGQNRVWCSILKRFGADGTARHGYRWFRTNFYKDDPKTDLCRDSLGRAFDAER